MLSLSEFKSWLDGFSESINGAPTIEQWKKIKTKLDHVFTSNTENYPRIPCFPQPWIDTCPPFIPTPPFRNGEIIC